MPLSEDMRERIEREVAKACREAADRIAAEMYREHMPRLSALYHLGEREPSICSAFRQGRS